MNIESIKQCIENIEKELVELKTYVNETKAEKTPNHLRYEIIEKAKKFVEIKSSYLVDSSECDGGFVAKSRENPNYGTFVTKCIFIVNVEKRTVVAILKYLNNSIIKKSIAKCNTSDVFNEHIGKAIALGRVLGLDVSDFEYAVQPTQVVVGQVVETYLPGGKHFETFEVDAVDTVSNELKMKHRNMYGYVSFDKQYGDKIINDTNAIYGGVE